MNLSAPKIRKFFPSVILGISLLCTAITTFYVYTSINESSRLRFENRTIQAQRDLNESLETYLAVLRSVAGYVNSQEGVTKREIQEYIQNLNIREFYPGMQGIGYVAKVENEQLPEFRANLSRLEMSDLEIFPEGIRDEYFPIIYLEPLDELNKKAIGFDMFTEKARKSAMLYARDYNIPVASGIVTLVQETDLESKQPGFLIFIPIYEKGKAVGTLEQRKERLTGFVYAPFRVDDFVSAVFENRKDPSIEFEIYDGETAEESMKIFSTSNEIRDDNYRLSKTAQVNNSSHTWTIVFTPNSRFYADQDYIFAYLFLIAGTIASLMIFLLSRAQMKSEVKLESALGDLSQSRRDLQDSTRNVTNILTSITDSFIALDKGWGFTYVNQAAAEMLGKTPEDLIGKNFWKQFPELADSDFKKQAIETVKKNSFTQYEAYYPAFKSWYDIRMFPSDLGITIYLQNINERKLLEQRKDEFLSIASHELKTPLTIIKGYSQMLERLIAEKSDSKLMSYLKNTNIYIDKLGDLISDLLDVTRIQSGKIQISYAKWDFDKFVKDAVQNIQNILPDHKIIIKGKVKKKVLMDKNRIEQVLTNLLSNAAKYSPKGTNIIITLNKDSNKVVVSVTDFGMGINKKDQKKIFRRFYRVEAIPKSISGLGIGLYISSEIVKRHKGTMWVESEEGKGSTFYFSIPLNKKL